MTAPSKVSGSPRNAIRVHEVLKARKVEARRFAISDGAPVEVLESGPSVAARVANLASRLTIRPILAVGSHAPNLPWPWGLIDAAARVLLPISATVRETVSLPNASAQLVRAPGVLPADGTRRVVVYLHGGAFLTCGANSHGRLVEALSKFADSPVLVVNYRLLPKHSVGMALNDCHDGAGAGGDDGVQANQWRAADEVTDVLRYSHAFIVSGGFWLRTPAPTAAEPRHLRVLAGGFADVLTDLAQRTDCLGDHRHGQLEVVDLAGPDPHLGRHTHRRQPARRQLRVVQQHFGSGDVDECPRQARLDVLQGLVSLFGFAVDNVLFGRASNQLDERIKRLRGEHRVALDVGVRLLAFLC